MWRLYNHKRNEAIHPLNYRSKSQHDLINEVYDALQEYDIVFLQGAVGTGKSVVALHLIAEFGKGIVKGLFKLPPKSWRANIRRITSKVICAS